MVPTEMSVASSRPPYHQVLSMVAQNRRDQKPWRSSRLSREQRLAKSLPLVPHRRSPIVASLAGDTAIDRSKGSTTVGERGRSTAFQGRASSKLRRLLSRSWRNRSHHGSMAPSPRTPTNHDQRSSVKLPAGSKRPPAEQLGRSRPGG